MVSDRFDRLVVDDMLVRAKKVVEKKLNDSSYELTEKERAAVAIAGSANFIIKKLDSGMIEVEIENVNIVWDGGRFIVTQL